MNVERDNKSSQPFVTCKEKTLVSLIYMLHTLLLYPNTFYPIKYYYLDVYEDVY